MKLKICEMFESIQGESSFAGFPFFFIRLTGCNLRCEYCDTLYAYDSGENINVVDIIKEVKKSWIDKVLITGGEPLFQQNVYPLIESLIKINKNVFIETNGSFLTNNIPKNVTKIIDFKTPSSNMSQFNDFENINYINENDEVKFVIGDIEDFKWSCNIIRKYRVLEKSKNILFSPVNDKISPSELAKYILKERINVRLQVQLHKFLKMK